MTDSDDARVDEALAASAVLAQVARSSSSSPMQAAAALAFALGSLCTCYALDMEEALKIARAVTEHIDGGNARRAN